MYNVGDVVETDQICLIVRVPKNTVAITIEANILDEDMNMNICKSAFPPDVFRKCRQDFLDEVGDDDYDATYVLTEEGKKYLEELKKNGNMWSDYSYSAHDYCWNCFLSAV